MQVHFLRALCCAGRQGGGFADEPTTYQTSTTKQQRRSNNDEATTTKQQRRSNSGEATTTKQQRRSNNYEATAVKQQRLSNSGEDISLQFLTSMSVIDQTEPSLVCHKKRLHLNSCHFSSKGFSNEQTIKDLRVINRNSLSHQTVEKIFFTLLHLRYGYYWEIARQK